ncbi:MAG: hypothetical protein QM761_04445 [Pseudoxanthomonas sp.]
MASSWITIAAPYLPEIVRLAKPLFTRTPPADNAQHLRIDVLNEQIAELQNAATTNADAIGKLAADMQKTLEVLQLGAERAEKRVQSTQRIAWVAVTAALLSFGLAAYALAN